MVLTCRHLSWDYFIITSLFYALLFSHDITHFLFHDYLSPRFIYFLFFNVSVCPGAENIFQAADCQPIDYDFILGLQNYFVTAK